MGRITYFGMFLVTVLLLVISCENIQNTDLQDNEKSEIKIPNEIQETPNEKYEEPGSFSECKSDSDCVIGGCSGTLCHKKGENIFTTCEYLPEYECYKQIECGCINNKCEWDKNAEFERCLQEKRSQGEAIY